MEERPRPRAATADVAWRLHLTYASQITFCIVLIRGQRV